MADSVFDPGIRVVVPWTRELDTPAAGHARRRGARTLAAAGGRTESCDPLAAVRWVVAGQAGQLVEQPA